MVRAANRLTAKQVEKLKEPGMHPDGEGLYLRVKDTGAKSWLYRFKVDSKARAMGLGSFPAVSLAKARELAAEARKLKRQGIDPIEMRKNTDGEAGGGRRITFEKAAERYIKDHEKGWRSMKTPDVWRGRLRDYAYPAIGKKDVAAITTADVVRCLKPIWYEKTETASKTRTYIEAVLSWAGVEGYRDPGRMNPAVWKDNLEHLLKRRSAFEIVAHHPAMPYADLPEFIVELRKRDAMSARAVEIIILTACRSGDARLAPWSELNLDKAIWTIPAARQGKNRREHRVPLSRQAVALLKGLPVVDDYVFPGAREGRPLSDMAFNILLRRMKVSEYHTHGFRSTFKDWAVEQTNYPLAISEMALAHDIGSGTEKAYRRSDFFEKRRALMQEWADFIDSAV